jgi:alkylated DNA repair dioxygenase AlkB
MPDIIRTYVLEMETQITLAELSLFDDTADVLAYTPPENEMTIVAGDPSTVMDLQFVPQFITSGEERVLLWEADRDGEWSTHWSRRTKSYGRSYIAPESEPSSERPKLPDWTDFVGRRLVETDVLTRYPNQMGINEYMPGQGIAPHVDYFGGAVVSLTLGCGCVMDFTRPDSSDTVSLWLPRRSIVVLQGSARTVWRHGIKGRLKDVVNGRVIRRDRRVSLTFRDVVR